MDKQLVSLEKMIEFDLHLGANTRLWNPKMSPYLLKEGYKRRHVINLEKTARHLKDVYSYLFDLSRSGLEIMFVSSKNKVISEIVKESAKRVNAFYITQR